MSDIPERQDNLSNVPPVANPGEFLLQEGTHLSKGIIWKMLEDFYATASIAAWNQVPFYPTSNPTISEAYADLIIAFLKDYYQHLNLEHPVWIVEMASGSGCFSYYLMKELTRKMTYFSELKNVRIKYLMTDFTANNVLSWQKNPKIQKFMQDGIVEFGIFRPEDNNVIYKCPEEAHMPIPTDTVLSKEIVKNPVITIANYFFDSIKQDAFQIYQGKLKEAMHRWASRKSPDEPGVKIVFDDLIKSETYVDTQPDYYEDPKLNKVLKQYIEHMEYGSVLFPIGPFQCIRNMLKISNHNLVLLSSDKGFTHESYMYGLREQPFVSHHGIFSYSVNYDAIAKYFTNQGGTSFSTSDDNLSVSCAANYLLSKPCSLDLSRYCFTERTDKLNMNNYLYFMQDLLIEVQPKKANEILRACLAYVQICNYDPIVFCLAAPRIYAAIETLTVSQEKRLYEIMEKVHDNFYSVQQQFDVFYWIGRMYYGLNRTNESLDAFTSSVNNFGKTSSSLYYVAACHEIRKEYEIALDYYQQTLVLEPGCQYTQGGIERVTNYLAQRK